jgi:hypothetical protein
MNQDIRNLLGRIVNLEKRAFGVYKAKVVNNIDRENKRRLDVLIPTLFSDFVIKNVECAEGDGNTFYLPKIGQVVWIIFEGGDTSFPKWFGKFTTITPVNGSSIPSKFKGVSYSDDRYGFQMPSGMSLIFDDTDTSIEIEHPTGTKIEIDITGKVTITGVAAHEQNITGNHTTQSQLKSKIAGVTETEIQSDAVVNINAPQINLNPSGEPIIKGTSFIAETNTVFTALSTYTVALNVAFASLITFAGSLKTALDAYSAGIVFPVTPTDQGVDPSSTNSMALATALAGAISTLTTALTNAATGFPKSSADMSTAVTTFSTNAPTSLSAKSKVQ